MKKERAILLLVDDDPRALRLERRVLENAGYEVLEASNGQDALKAILEKPPTLVLLDIGMPHMDGFVVCQRIREFSQVPIILLTGQGSEEDKVRGLESGADDYVTKPFSAKELVARVKAVLRRLDKGEDVEKGEAAIRVGDLLVDFASKRVTLAGQEVLVSATEYRLLACLARNAGRVLTPDQILERVWGEEYIGEVHLLRVAIGRLRQKLSDHPHRPSYIITRPGIGYGLVMMES